MCDIAICKAIDPQFPSSEIPGYFFQTSQSSYGPYHFRLLQKIVQNQDRDTSLPKGGWPVPSSVCMSCLRGLTQDIPCYCSTSNILLMTYIMPAFTFPSRIKHIQFFFSSACCLPPYNGSLSVGPSYPPLQDGTFSRIVFFLWELYRVSISPKS